MAVFHVSSIPSLVPHQGTLSMLVLAVFSASTAAHAFQLVVQYTAKIYYDLIKSHILIRALW